MQIEGRRATLGTIHQPTLDDLGLEDHLFINLMLGLYLMYVGSVRKGFSLTELPFDNDGSELYENGKELFENTIEELKGTDGSWYNAIV